jgi:hypothetical protein
LGFALAPEFEKKWTKQGFSMPLFSVFSILNRCDAVPGQ